MVSIFHRTESRTAEQSSAAERRARDIQILTRWNGESSGVFHDRVDYWVASILILTPWLILLLR